MRFNSKIDLSYKILMGTIIFILILSFGALIISMPELSIEEQLALVVLITATLLFMLSITFNTYYEFKEDYLYCRSGVFAEKIKYDKIQSVKKSKNMFSSMALSRDRIEIKTSNNIITGVTYISPERAEEFLKILEEKRKQKK